MLPAENHETEIAISGKIHEMKSVSAFISGHSDTRSEKVVGKASLSKIANKQTNAL